MAQCKHCRRPWILLAKNQDMDGRCAPSRFERQPCSMLWDTKDVCVSGECDVERNCLRASRLAVRVSAEALIPPCAFVLDRLFDLLLFFLGFLLTFLLFFLGLLNLGSPVLDVHVATLVELDLCLAVALELDTEGCMSDDGLVLAALAVGDLGVAVFRVRVEGSALGRVQTSNKSPLCCLIVSLLSRFAVVAECDVALCPLLLVESNACDTRFEKRDGKRQTSLLLAFLQCLEHDSIQLSVVECDGGRVENIG